MMTELLLRFVLGGAVVSIFAIIGELWEPKTFGGLFGAAPSIALVALGVTFATTGRAYAATQAHSMVVGVVAFFVYCLVCVVSARVKVLPLWLEAGAAWIAWFITALPLHAVAGRLGWIRLR